LSEKVQSLSNFMERVQQLREETTGRHPPTKELWFRGERFKFREQGTLLRPVLYRPGKGTSLKPIDDLLQKEVELYEDFMRCCSAAQ